MDTEKDAAEKVGRDELLMIDDEELRNLPRHKWDAYLWKLSCEFVGLEPDSGPVPPVKSR